MLKSKETACIFLQQLRSETEQHSYDAAMHSHHNIDRPQIKFKDNGVIINARETVCIFTQPNLHRFDLCFTQHPASLKGGMGAPEIYNEVRENAHMLIISLPNAVNTLWRSS